MTERTTSADTASPAPDPLDMKSLDRHAVKGAAWMGAAKWSTQLLAWLSTILVARLLLPRDYGIVTMAGVYFGLVGILSEFGIGTAIVTLRQLDRRQVAQFNSLSVLLGAASFGVSLLAAWPIGAFFRSPELPAVVIALSSTFLIGSLQVVPSALLRRDLQFRSLALIDVVRGFIVPVGTLAFAAAGFGYWSLVLSALLGSLLTTGMTLRARRAPFARVRLAELGTGVRFSREVLIGRVGWFVYSDSDFAVAGRRLGEAALGAYSLAWTVANSPIEKLTALLTDVVPSVFSAAQHDVVALRRYFLNLVELVGLVTIPVAFGISLISHDFVEVVLGPSWHGAAGPLALLAAYAAVRSLTPLLGFLVPVTGQTAFGMWSSLATAIALPVAFYVGSYWGGVGIALAWMTVHPITTFFTYRRLQRIVGWRTRDFFVALRLGLDGSLAMVCVVMAMRHWLPAREPRVELGIDIVCGMLVYGAVTLVLHRRRLLEILGWFRRVRQGG